ncbi:hypothetical protein SCOCK_130135 [Actinacidiphila cocklensis]|uniref:Uncharacterized protein n=1 Tax=Actinacidiphila cocklensis TaxID=887465 RepID=A0A9W4DQM2_9ACTN|nr:hypothetical protein SCOCK_130135 [Actinacidiphila cocklensis]
MTTPTRTGCCGRVSTRRSKRRHGPVARRELSRRATGVSCSFPKTLATRVDVGHTPPAPPAPRPPQRNQQEETACACVSVPR